ncbi:TetR family transcriptional regulator protein (plasmid) [Rhizobium sp. Kim5]|nr:TetR family transcriptional regulator protein [Rhizobium sp. Kim5]
MRINIVNELARNYQEAAPDEAERSPRRNNHASKVSASRSDTRERLLGAAIELFGSRGFDATSMKDIANEVGIKAPAVYNHYKSKEELLAGAVTEALGAFNEAIAAADSAGAAPLERLQSITTAHILYQINHSRIAQANDRLLESGILSKLDPSVRHKVKGMMREHLDRLTKIVEAIPSPATGSPPEARLTALAIITMCDNVLNWYRPSGPYTPEKICKHFYHLAQNMLLARTGAFES